MTANPELILERQNKDRFFKTHPQSPLTPEQKALFQGLQYYPPNPALDLTLPVEEFAQKANVKMLTTTGDTRYYMRWGKVSFEVEGQATELVLFYAPGSEDFFVPFMDATTGHETYGSGRYVEAQRLGGGRVHLDFNVAYSPYCAYNEPLEMAEAQGRDPRAWNCPIPPQENRLKVAIRAGEKSPIGDWVITDHA
jgi:uncharacterized protein (DUF1684 family)